MNDKRILKNIGISMVMKPISMLLSFVYIPIVLSYLGEEKYGVWAIILNIISWINYFDIGIGNGLRNRLTEAIAMDDKENARKYVSTAYVGAIFIAIIFFVTISLLWKTFGLSSFFKLNLADEDVDRVILMSIFFVCINFVLSLSKTSAYAVQIPSLISIVGVCEQLVQVVLLIALIKSTDSNLCYIALIYGIVTLLGNVAIFLMLIKDRTYLIPSVHYIDKKHLKPLITLGLGFFALQICSLILNTTDNLLISRLFGSAEVTPYNMVYKVFYLAVQVHAIVIMPMWSAYTEAATKKDLEWIEKTQKKVNLVTLIISLGVIIGIFLFEPFSFLWLHRQFEYGKLLIIIVAIYMIAQMFGNNYSAFLCGVGNIKVSSITSIIGAIINIPLSIFFAKACDMGLAGIIFGSFCVMAIGVILLPIISFRWIRNKSKEWSKNEKSI